MIKALFNNRVNYYALSFGALATLIGMLEFSRCLVTRCAYQTNGNSWLNLQFEMTLSIALLGLAIVLLTLQFQRAARLIGAACILIGIAGLLDYITGIHLSVSHFLYAHWFNQPDGSHIHLTGNAAICIVLSGCSLFFGYRRRSIMLSTGVGVFLVCVITSFSYIFSDLGLSRLSTLPPQDLLAYFAICGGLFSYGYMNQGKNRLDIWEIAPLAFSISSIVIMLLLNPPTKDTIVSTGIILSILFSALLFVFFNYLVHNKKVVSQQVEERTKELKKLREKAEQENALKTEFLVNMSHEIRTPMNGILGMAELILNNNPPTQIEEYARTIVKSGTGLQRIIDEILDFSKLESQKVEIHHTPMDLMDLVNEVVALYSPKAFDRRIPIVVNYSLDARQFFIADDTRIKQVLGNLLNNAIKFTDRGHIVVQVEEEESSLNLAETANIRLSVKDTGIGISETARENIFEEFRQADGSTTRQYGGTGLGLSISKQLVELMDGVIGVESVEGQGSTFWFQLPLTINTAEVQLKPQPPVLKDVHALIVNPLPVITEMTSKILNSAGMRCDGALNAEQAMKLYVKSMRLHDPYDVVILSNGLPDNKGKDVIQEIQYVYPEKKPCFILLKDLQEVYPEETIFEDGFNACIHRPLTNLDLIEKTSIIMTRHNKGETGAIHHSEYADSSGEIENNIDIRIPDKNILVAEDNIINQSFIKAVLDEMQCSYTIVDNGQEAVDIVQNENFDLIIMDCLMPIMDGFDATKRICEFKESGKIADINIIALTANAMASDREKCLQAGMDHFMSKPIRIKALKEMIILGLSKDGSPGYTAEEKVSSPPAKPELRKQPATTNMPAEEVPVQVQKQNKPQRQTQPQVKMRPMQNDQQAAGKTVTSGKKNEPVSREEGDVILDANVVQNAQKILKHQYKPMVQVFIDQTKMTIGKIDKLVNENNVDEIIRPAHTLKSTSKQMGAMTMSQLAKEIEATAKQIAAGNQDAGQGMKKISGLLNKAKLVIPAVEDSFKKHIA